MSREGARHTDWHVHTHHSDGFASPEEVIRRAAELGLTRVAITDHDCIEAHRGERYAAFAQTHGLFLIPGVEIDCRLGDDETEVLGLGFDPDYAPLVERLERIGAERTARFRFYCERLAAAGEPVEPDAVLTEHVKVPIKVHLYRYLAAAGRSFDGGYREFKAALDALGESPEVDKPTIEESVSLIRDADGYALLAHPLFFAERFGLETLLEAGRDAGCVGAELFYPYDFGEKGLATERVREGYRELLRLLPEVFPSGAEASRGTDMHDLDEWPARLAAVERWERELLGDEDPPKLLPG